MPTPTAVHSHLPAPPGPAQWPVLGNLPAIRRDGLVQFLEHSWKRHGDVFRVDIGTKAVVLAHPEAIKHVLAGHRENYIKGKTYDGVRRVIGNGLLALEGDAWKARRNMVQPAFHRSGLGKLTQAMADSGRAHFSRLAERAATGWTPIDLHREMVALTLDVVVAALFGRELQQAAQVSYEALADAMEHVSARSNAVVLPAWVPTPGNRRFHRTMEEVEGAVYRVIAAGKERTGDDGTLLSMLLNSRDADTGQPLSDREVRDEVFTMFVAGHETTALTLTWLFTLLEGREDVVSRMRAEVNDVLGGREPTFDDFSRLTYLKQVVDESLRLRGPTPMTARTAVADDEIGGFGVRAGEVVIPFFWGTHRHPDFWREPDRFDPERFTAAAHKGRHPWCYLPFSGGQRTCIGNMFSLVETVVLMAQFLARFDFEVIPNQNVVPQAMSTLRPSKPVMLNVRRRA
jgi:cytochrome P450